MTTILIVDDKMSAQRLVADYLGANGYQTVTANDGKEALFVARHEKPDLVLLDIMMLEMDGFEFMRRFRKENKAPVIMLTVKVEETDKVIGLELGADDEVQDTCKTSPGSSCRPFLNPVKQVWDQKKEVEE